MAEVNKYWKLYDSGLKYNQQLEIDGSNYYDTINANIDFYHGNQWRNQEESDLPQMVFNVIKRVITFQQANLLSDNVKAIFDPLENHEFASQLELDASNFVTSEVGNLFEKFNFQNRLRDVVQDGAISGDGCIHFYFDKNKKPYRGKLGAVKGEICLEVIDGQNIMFGNANCNIVEKQPYIVVIGRDLASKLSEEAGKSEIKADYDTQFMAGTAGRIEVEADEYGKALYIIVYKKNKDGNVTATKATKDTIIYENVDTGLEYYPISWFNWEKQKNQQHGRSPITGMLPNQIAINRMYSMMAYHQMQSAFPGRAYDSDRIPYLTNQIGEDIAISGLQNGERVDSLIANLKPADMGGQIQSTIDSIFQNTKEMLGISDAAMGNINNPENTSAIISTQKAAIIPLENVKANLNEFIEDCARILVDMMATYYGVRPVLIEDEQGKRLVEFDFNQLKDIYLSMKLEVGNTTAYSEPAQVQTLTTLLQNGSASYENPAFEFFLERIPDNIIPKRKEALAKFKQIQAQNNQQQLEHQIIGEFVDMLPPEYQELFNQKMAEMQNQQ